MIVELKCKLIILTKDTEINDRYFLLFGETIYIYIYYLHHDIIQEINNNNSRNQYIIHIRCNGFRSHSRMAFRGRRRRSYYRILLYGLEIRVVSRGRIWQVLLGSTVWNALFWLFFFIIIIIRICVQHTRLAHVWYNVQSTRIRDKSLGRQFSSARAFVHFRIHHSANDPHNIASGNNNCSYT